MIILNKSKVSLLYPGYLLLNKSLTIIEIGRKLFDATPNLLGTSFANNFSIVNVSVDYESITKIEGIDCIINFIPNNSIILEGKFIKLEATEEFFFAGKMVLTKHQAKNVKSNIDNLDILKLETALDTIGNTFWFHNLETTSAFSNDTIDAKYNEGFYDFFGRKCSTKAKIWFESIHPEDRWMLINVDKAYREGKITKHALHYRIFDKNGNLRWISDAGIVYNYKNGWPHELICTHSDITYLYVSRAELDKQKHFYETILNNLPADIAVFDENHTYLFVNPRGIKNEEIRQWIIGKKDEDYIKLRNLPETVLNERRQTFNEVKRTLVQKSWEQEILKPDGTKEYILRIFHPYVNENGKFELAIGYGINITERKLIEQQIQISEKKYRNLIDKSLAVITIHDMKGVFTMVNPRIEEILGYPVKDVIGKHITYYMHADDAELVNKNYLQTIQNEKIAKGVFRFIDIQGGVKHILYNNYLVDNDGDDAYVISHKVDITERINAEKVVKAAQIETEAAAIAKERFLATMSHELRTPMNGIMGIISFLEKTILTNKQQEYIHLLKNSSNNILVVLNQILDIEKIIAGKLELEKIHYDVAKKIIDVIDTLKYKALEKHLEITFNNFMPNNLSILGDAFRLGQILLNLLSNAIKFTKDYGTIIVSAQVISEVGNHMILQFSVADTGIGIDKQQQKHIFNSYTQASASVARKFGGSGLGLSICKQLVEIQQGSIGLKSAKNKGTTVTFTILYDKWNKASTLKKAKVSTIKSSPSNDVLSGLHILIAEDVELNQYVVKTMLENWGCQSIVIVENGKEAIAAIEKQNFSVVLMDIQMPLMDGFKATRVIRKLVNKQKATIPIIALTANVFKNISEKIEKCGMNDCIYKPFNEQQLIEVLQKYSIVEANIVTNTTINTVNKAYNTTILKNAAYGNMEFMIKMAEIFRRTAPVSCSIMQDALANNDWLKIDKEAHKLKFSTDFFGLTNAKKIILNIQKQVATTVKPVTFTKQTQQLIVILQNHVAQLQKDFVV